MESSLRIRDRQSGALFDERVFGGGALHFLYGRGMPRLLTDHVLTGALAHRIYGALKRAPRSRREIPEFVRSLGIDAAEAERPLAGYASLDDFFTRRLRPGARPVDATPEHLVSPADGRALAFARLDGGALPFIIKGARVDLAELLGDPRLAAQYAGGAALVVRLAPADYHRFHFPDGGVASAARSIPGRLHSVHPIALAAGAPSFRNRRAVSRLASTRFGTLALVEVGALCVGTIVQTYRPGAVERGAEKGIFHFGGSTVVLLAAPGRLELDEDLLRSSAEGIETLVHMGTRIGRAR